MKEVQEAKMYAKITWELGGEKCAKYFLQNLEKRKSADQTRVYILLKVGKTAKYLLKEQQEILKEVKKFY